MNTKEKLLALAKERGGRYSIETASGRGAKGGRISCGKRDRSALFALESEGLIEITDTIKSSDMMGNGNMCYSTVFAFRIK